MAGAIFLRGSGFAPGGEFFSGKEVFEKAPEFWEYLNQQGESGSTFGDWAGNLLGVAGAALKGWQFALAGLGALPAQEAGAAAISTTTTEVSVFDDFTGFFTEVDDFGLGGDAWGAFDLSGFESAAGGGSAADLLKGGVNVIKDVIQSQGGAGQVLQNVIGSTGVVPVTGKKGTSLASFFGSSSGRARFAFNTPRGVVTGYADQLLPYIRKYGLDVVAQRLGVGKGQLALVALEGARGRRTRRRGISWADIKRTKRVAKTFSSMSKAIGFLRGRTAPRSRPWYPPRRRGGGHYHYFRR